VITCPAEFAATLAVTGHTGPRRHPRHLPQGGAD